LLGHCELLHKIIIIKTSQITKHITKNLRREEKIDRRKRTYC